MARTNCQNGLFNGWSLKMMYSFVQMCTILISSTIGRGLPSNSVGWISVTNQSVTVGHSCHQSDFWHYRPSSGTSGRRWSHTDNNSDKWHMQINATVFALNKMGCTWSNVVTAYMAKTFKLNPSVESLRVLSSWRSDWCNGSLTWLPSMKVTWSKLAYMSISSRLT